MDIEYTNGRGEKIVVKNATVVPVGPPEPICPECGRRESYQSMEELPGDNRCKKCGRK